MRAKENFSQSESVLSPTKFKFGVKTAADYHWFPEKEFEKHVEAFEIDDSNEIDSRGATLFPRDQILIRYGNLARIHFRAPSAGKHPRREKDTTITFSKPVAKESHLVFDPSAATDMLYMKIKPSARAFLAKRFWTENVASPRPLSEWALLAGGAHARAKYPTLEAKPVGIMTAVVYYTFKKDDEKACFYIHRMGEVSHYLPILACDSVGRLWICGGNFRNVTPGITD